MKVVIDTNLLVAVFFNKQSASFKIFKMAEQGKVDLLWSDGVKKEAEFILGKIKKSVGVQQNFLKEVFKPNNKVENPPQVNVVEEDPEDDKFLACAQKGKVDLIVSNDKHLLEVGEFKGIPVVNSKQALKNLKDS